MYSAFYNWTIKLGISVSIALSGIWLIITGFDAKHGVNQSPQTILYMRLVDIVIPALLIGSAIWLLSRYSITAAQMTAVRVELDRRERKLIAEAEGVRTA
jgi:Na+/melibiose symporter-like transporter